MIQKILWLLLWMFPIEFFGQLPTSIHLEKSVGLPSNEIYDLFQDRDEFVWLATQEGLYRYDGHQYKGYQYSNQYSRAGNKIIQDTAGRIWYFSFDGYLYYVENDSLHLFNPALGNLFNYCIFKNHLFIHQKKNILIYNLNKLTLLNSISLGDRLITDISVLKDGIILENSEVPLLLDSIGNVKDLNFSLSDNLVTRYVQNGHRIFGIQKNKSDQILVEVDKEKVMPTINIFNKGVNKFYIIKDEIFILEQDKINIISKYELNNNNYNNIIDLLKFYINYIFNI